MSALQASAGLSAFGLAYWSLFKSKASDRISSETESAPQQADIIQLIDQESRKSSNKYWQGELEGRGSDKV